MSETNRRVVSTAAELHALAPRSVIMDVTPDPDHDPALDQDDFNTITAHQKRADGQWVGGFLVQTAEQLVAARNPEYFRTGFQAQVLYEAPEVREPHEVFEAAAPSLIARLRGYFDQEWPGMTVRIRRSKQAVSQYKPDVLRTNVNVQWEQVSGVPLIDQQMRIHKAVYDIVEELGLPGAYLNLRHKKPVPAVTVAAVRKIVKSAGFRTHGADQYSRAKGYSYIRFEQRGDAVQVQVAMNRDVPGDDKNPRGVTARSAAAITEALTEQGYTVAADSVYVGWLTVSKPEENKS